jgi:hypothetical protein
MTLNDQELCSHVVAIQLAARKLNEATPETMWKLLEEVHVHSRDGLYRLVSLSKPLNIPVVE